MLLGLIAVASQDRSEFDGMPEQGYVRLAAALLCAAPLQWLLARTLSG